MRSITPAPREEWRAVLAGDPMALPEHGPEWVDALCAVGPYANASRLYVTEDDRQFVLPMVRRTGPLGVGGWWQSYPTSWGMGGVIGAGLDAAVLGEILRDLGSQNLQRFGVRPDPLHHDIWTQALAASSAKVVRIPRRAHVIDLEGGAGAIFSRMSKSSRRGVRVAERSGVRIEVDRGGALLDDYYGLYLTSVDRWAARQHEPRALARARARRRDPLRKLRAMSDLLGKAFMVTLAYVDDQPAFGSVTLLGQTAHDTRAAMDVDLVGKTYAGDLVQWTSLQVACDLGCPTFHLGESGQSASLALYKEKFGARPHDYAEFRLERLPYTRVDQGLRAAVKKVLRFSDV